MRTGYESPRIAESWPLVPSQLSQIRGGHLDRVADELVGMFRLIGLFRRLFVGRDDAFLAEPGTCIKRPLTLRVIRDHILGRRRIGAYSLIKRTDGAYAKFLAFDLDGKNLPGGRDEALAQANTIAEVLEDLDLAAYIEVSRSGLGFHVWVFFGEEIVPLQATKRLGELVLELANLSPQTEVFPKGSESNPYGATPYLPLHGLLSSAGVGAVFVTPDGRPYEDQAELLADIKCATVAQVTAAIADAADKCRTAARNAPVRPAKERVDVASILSGVPEGRRDSEIFRTACRLRQVGVPLPFAERLVVEAAANCSPPFPTEQAARKVRNAYDRYPAGQGDESIWTPPTPFQTLQLPPFPVDALPNWLGEYVAAEATATQTPADLAGGVALSVCGSASARRVEVSVKSGWVEPANVYTVAVQPPGTRKSSVFSHLVRPIEEFEQREAVRMAPLIKEAQARRAIAEERLKKARRDAAKATLLERKELEDEAVRAALEASEIEVPVVPRLIADDCTPERLATLLRDHGGRIALMSAEGDVFDLMSGRYSSNGESSLGVYLKGHAGDTLRVDRVTRGSEHVPKPALSIGLTIQPFVLQGLVNRPGFKGRGLLGRFLYALPKNLLGQRDVDPLPVPQQIQDRYDRNVRSLLALRPALDENGREQPHTLRLDSKAWERLKEFLEWLEPQLGEHAELGTLTDWAGKLGGAVARLAGILHIAEHVHEGEPWQLPIEGDTLDRAIRLGEYYLAHARAAFAEMGADPEVEAARYVIGWITRKRIDRFSKRDAFEGTKGRFRRVKELEPVLDLLVEHGHIREAAAEEASRGRGRRPSPVFEVNPYLRSDDAAGEVGTQTHSANSANTAKDEPNPIPRSASGHSSPESNSANSAKQVVATPATGATALPRRPQPELTFKGDSQNSQYSQKSSSTGARHPSRGRCRGCGTENWWTTPAGDPVCGTCHPPIGVS